MSGKLDVMALMNKAVIDDSTLPSSVLNRQQADRFIDLVIDESVLLQSVRNVRINHPSGSLNKLDLGSIVTEGATATTTPRTRTPQESVVNYDTVKYRSAFDLATNFVEDNIEGANVRDTLLNMFAKRIATDSEIAAIEGDESLPTGDGESDSNNLLGVNDGWFKILATGVPADQQIDAAGTASSRKLFFAMKREIQTRYRVSRPDYRWLVSAGVYDKWELDEGEDNTGSEGQIRTRQQGTVGRRPFGITMMEVPLFPEDLAIGTVASDATKLLLTPLMNLLWFIQREITIEWDRIPRQDLWEVTIHYRTDVEVENQEMVVMANNVSETGTDFA